MSNVHGTICNTLFLIMSFLIVSFTLSAAETDSYMTQSRLAAKQFAEELKAELMSAIENGGPINAVSVCEEKAPAIAEKISNDKGWAVGRTSLKFRNPTNAPDGWEKKVLANFEKQKSKGESLDSLEYGEVVTVNGKKQFRYMRAILTQKPCLTCHGANISKDLSEKLQKLYPKDKARGFKEGDIRGAFTITRPLKN